MVVPEIDLTVPNFRAAAGVAAGWLSWAWTSPGARTIALKAPARTKAVARRLVANLNAANFIVANFGAPFIRCASIIRTPPPDCLQPLSFQ